MPRVNVKDKRKQQLMEANMASIAKRGLTETTIAYVSKGAGMSRGIVNFYFTSKEKMMQETLIFLADEFTATWQDAIAAKSKETTDPKVLIETILSVLMSDRVCSAKRLAVWAAFVGHAGTHAGYAKTIRMTDEILIKQLKELWQKTGLDAKTAEQRARQMQALIRGHHVLGALGIDDKKPSSYSEAWIGLLNGSSTSSIKEKVTKPPTPKKAAAPLALPGQLDFGDLFSKG